MEKVLYIKANPKSDRESRTFQLSERFVQSYRSRHSDAQITTLDLYKENVRPLTEEEVRLTHSRSGGDDPILRYARQFHEADKYVVAAPLWNLGTPSILKSYIDYIMIVGINFSYTETGPLGLCGGKKAIHVTTRGGVYSEGPFAAYEMGDRYLRTVFGFLGICEFTTLAAEGLDIQGADVASIMDKAMKRGDEIAAAF